MKNKKTIYILVPLVAVVWGLIIWKVVAFRPEQLDSLPNFHTGESQEPADSSPYELRLNFRDPFLRSVKQTSQKAGSQEGPRQNNIKKVDLKGVVHLTKPQGWSYHGVISGGVKTVGLLEIEGQKRLIKENERVGDIRILAVDVDSLRISYMEKKFAYGKQ